MSPTLELPLSWLAALTVIVATVAYTKGHWVGKKEGTLKRRQEEATVTTPREREATVTTPRESWVTVGFCFSCKKQTRLSCHCDGCGGHSRHNIVEHTIRSDRKEHICTQCAHLALYPDHCGFCKTNRVTIVELRRY